MRKMLGQLAELWVYLVPLLVLAGIVAMGTMVKGGRIFCSEPTINLHLPSEKMISEPVPARTIDEQHDQVWRFRYAPTGTEGRAGIPYWIFRVMPRLFPARFNGRGYDVFGFDDDDREYYQRRGGDARDGKSFRMPRGTVLVDGEFDLPLFHFKLGIKRVALNCSACHRGKYLREDQQPVFVDGMPNHTADLQSFKRLFESAVQDPVFNSARVIQEIDAVLAEEQQPALGYWDRAVYTAIVDLMRRIGKNDSGKWQNERPDNGPGRIDPFNAVKYEVLGAADDHTAATLDFPSLWNQRPEMRRWHHYDGNTDDSEARNYGSVMGVGGFSFTVNKPSITEVGKWIDELPPPKYPFADDATEKSRADGKTVFGKLCAGCHGTYDRATNSVTPGPQFMQVQKVDTDEQRWRAFPAPVAAALNQFGYRRNLWGATAFRAAGDGYLAGPLDGIWARAPYLHNGSVPTLNDLLLPVSKRPSRFCRGNPSYDRKKVGFHSELDEKTGKCDRTFFEYDTSLPGNRNVGHEKLPASDKDRADLIAYLRTL